ncbi:MAG: AsmA family protein [Bacteroidetes bacterium]|nr:AsmA family protein [Bacteroidota bacterium]
MKKFLKITAIVIALIISLLVILPFAFKGKIVEQIKIAINENVNAKVDFDSFSLSFIRSFPDVNFSLYGLKVINNAPFEGQTLADIKRLSVTVNIMSFFGGDGYEIKTIHLEKPYINAIFLKDGSANWDIMLESEDTDEVDTEDNDSDFKLALKRISIRNATIIYDDRDMDLYARLENSNYTIKGDFTASTTNVSVRETTADAFYLVFEGIPLLNGVNFDLKAELAADLEAFSFTFLDNIIKFNDLTLLLDGNISMPKSDIIMDITFGSPQTAFKSFLSLIPAIYSKDFADLKTEGTLAFNGFAKGVLGDETIPAFEFNLIVNDGMFQYPDLPAAVKNVNINTKIFNPGGSADLSVVDISKLTFTMAGNPVDFKLNLKTPISDPQIDAFLKGKIDLSKVKDFYPLGENESLSGIIDSDISAKGKMSSIEKEKYNEFLFDGKLVITDMNYKSEDFPQGILISKMDFGFNPRFVELKTFSVKMGESDFSANGRIDNLLGYMLNDDMLTGSFSTNSRYLDLNQFFAEETSEADTKEPSQETDSVEMTVIEVPSNINFTLRSSFGKLIFDNMEMTNVSGTIKVADQTVVLQNLQMNMLEGSMAVNGLYSSKNVKQPEIDFNLDIRQFDIQKTFKTFNTFAKLAPIGERAAGKFSAGLTIKSLLDEQMNPVVNSMAGAGNFISNTVKVTNSPTFTNIAEQLKMDRFKEITFNDVNVKFKFKDGRIDVEPFDVNFGNSKANINGYHSFDQTINYLAKFEIPRSEFGGAANDALSGLINQAATSGIKITPGNTVFVGAAITGTVTNPKVSLNLAQSTSDLKDQVIEQVTEKIEEIIEDIKEQAKEKVEEVKEKVSEELEKRAQQVIKEAEKQAENIRKEAAVAAKKLRDEARANAKKLEDEATGPIAKAAARKTGQEMIATADNNAKKLEDEADAKAKKVILEANQKADRIRAGKE